MARPRKTQLKEVETPEGVVDADVVEEEEEELEPEEPIEVQAPKRREIWSFTQLEVLQVACNVVVICRDDRGKKLGTLPLEQRVMFETEDMIEWLEALDTELNDPDKIEELRASVLESMQGQPGGVNGA